MKTSTRYDPFEHADLLGITLKWDDWCLTPDEFGAWLSRENTIYVRPGLTYAHERSIVAHELGHAYYDHQSTTPKNEMLANRYAIANLIRLEDLLDVMRCTPDMGRWAIELQVTGRLLRIYLNVHRFEIERAIATSHLARMAS